MHLTGYGVRLADQDCTTFVRILTSLEQWRIQNINSAEHWGNMTVTHPLACRECLQVGICQLYVDFSAQTYKMLHHSYRS